MGGSPPAEAPGKTRRGRTGAEDLAAYLARCEADGRDAIPADDPVHRYAEAVGIDRDILALHWREFRRRRLEAGKGQRDWPQTFRNSVRGNWYRLWLLRAGERARLTTEGEQARREMEAEAAQAAAAERKATNQGERDDGCE